MPEKDHIPETSQTMQEGHLDTKPAFCMFVWDKWNKNKKSYAKKSSTTVDKVLYIIAFIGICATLLSPI